MLGSALYATRLSDGSSTKLPCLTGVAQLQEMPERCGHSFADSNPAMCQRPRCAGWLGFSHPATQWGLVRLKSESERKRETGKG